MFIEKTERIICYLKNNEIESTLDLIILNYIKQNINKENISLKDFILFFEKKIICTAVSLTNGNQSHAADILGVSKTTLNGKIKKLRILKTENKSMFLSRVEDKLSAIAK